MSENQNRRQSVRVQLLFPCSLSYAGSSELQSSMLLDISVGGQCCSLKQALPQHVEYVKTNFEKYGVNFESYCKIVWRNDAEKKYGLSFVEPYPETYRLIEKIQKDSKLG